MHQATITQAIQPAPTTNKPPPSSSVPVDTGKSITFGVTGGWVMRPISEQQAKDNHAKEQVLPMINVAVTAVNGSTRKDVLLSFDAAEPGSRLCAALDESLGIPAISQWRVERTGELIDKNRQAGEGAVLHGDTLVATADQNSCAVHLRREGTSGPTRIDLPQGQTVVGRATGQAGTVIDDPTVSQRHLRIDRTATKLSVHNLSKTNGTFINGTRIDDDRVLQNGDRIELGDSTVYIVVLDRPTTQLGSHLRPVAGRLQFNRPPRGVRDYPGRTVEVAAAPEQPRSRRFPLALIILPMAAGALIVALTGNVAFLAFGLLGPMMGGWNWFDDRKSGRREFKSASAQYRADLETARARAVSVSTEVSAWRDWAYPTSERLIDRSRTLSDELWDRQPGHSDFLDVRLGSGDLQAPDRVRIMERGTPALVAEAHQRLDEFATDYGAPVALSLGLEPVVGITGGSINDRRGLARALIVQLATRNSPNDIALGSLGSADWLWMTWLPHANRPSAKAPLVGFDTDTRERVLSYLEHMLAARAAAKTANTTASDEHVVIVVEPPFELQATRLKAVLAAAATGGVSIIWLAEQRQTLPAEAGVFVEFGPTTTVRRTVGDQSAILTITEAASAELASATARTLAPLTDPGAADNAAVPDHVGLFDVLGADVLDPGSIAEGWKQANPNQLLAAIGIGRSGPLLLDLGNDGDGPHGLVAGSTGSGKSEFLQALVLSLAANYSPKHLNFLFVDFKGGLTFRDLVGLPHAVGMVRNLDTAMALRAKRSLQAEARRRQRILHHHGAVNLNDLRQRAPHEQLPALVIIVDEYAELAQKLPEFLESLVEVAQTGRALGLHLLLATQSPGQSVSKNIQNCVKYRISFRLEDSSESMAVLGRGRDAAQLPNRAGRGLLRDGNARLHEFQAAWAGGRSDIDEPHRASAATLYGPRPKSKSTEGVPTDLDRVTGSIQAAAALAQTPAPRRPWLEPLEGILALADLLGADAPTSPRGNTSAPIGQADLPDSQSQPSYDWDLATTQNLLIVGDGMTGKTTALRTIAAAFSELNDSSELLIVGIDSTGGGLTSLNVLPNTVAVVAASDQSRLRRVLAYLQRLVLDRRTVVGAAGSLRTYRQAGGGVIPNVIVLIDGLEHLLSTLEVLDAGMHSAALVQLISDGPAMGVHFAMTTEQPQRIPMSIANAAPERLVLRMASRDASNAAGLQGNDLTALADGRAISSRTRAEVQISVTSDGAACDSLSQAAALASAAQRLRDSGRRSTQRLPDPPDPLTPSLLQVPQEYGQLTLGIDDITLEPLTIDAKTAPSLIVMGPDLSGRSTVLEWIRHSLVKQSDGRIDTVFVSGRGDAPLNPAGWSTTCLDLASAVTALESRLAGLANATAPLLVAIDDGDELIETPIGGSPEETQMHRRFTAAMDGLVRAGRTPGVICVLAGRLNSLTRVSGWPQRMRQNQQAVVLSPATLSVTFTDPVFNVTFPRRSDYVSRRGHGVLLRRGVADVIQLVRL